MAGVTLMTVDGEMVSRMEVFDEGDLDAALAKFDQLSRPAPHLENQQAKRTSASGDASPPATGPPWRSY